ncbi:DMT family transporter [bacterium]|nr:DMT family transporter [bacterium]
MGELFALLCALFWAVAVIFFKRSGESVAPFALNLFRVGVSSVLLVVTCEVVGQPLSRAAPWRDVLILMGGGVLSIAIADTMFHKCLNMVGAAVTAIVDCLYAPLMILFAYLLLGETVGVTDLLGMVLVVGGVLLAVGRPHADALSRARRARGMLWGVGAMTALTLGVIAVKPVLERQPVVWATTVRQLGALAVMLPVALASTQRRRLLGVFVPRADWRFTLSGTVAGSYLALMFWLAGLKYEQAGVAAILNQTSTVYVLILAALVLREEFTRRTALAAVLALGGILLVTLA